MIPAPQEKRISFQKTILRWFASAIAVSSLICTPAFTQDWEPRDGEELRFEVLRKGNPFGFHTVRFERSGENLTVESDIELEVKIGPFRAFYYRHQSEENWVDEGLVSLVGETRKDGDDFTVSLKKENDVLDVDGTLYDGEVPSDIVPSSHWNIDQIRSSSILSTESGEILEIEVQNLGDEQIQAGGEWISATRYRLISQLNVDLWYDESGRWVKCSFEARGQEIEYVLL